MTTILDQLILAEIRLAGPLDDTADAVAALVRSKVVVQEDGTFNVLHANLDGSVASLADLIADMKASKPALFKQAEPTPAATIAPPAAMTTAGTFAARSASIQAAKDGSHRQMADKAAAFGNPWRAGSVNFTHQMLINRGNPGLASILKAEAGVR